MRSALRDDALVDVHSLANAQDTTDTDYFTDGTHPTAALVTDMANAVEAAIEGL